MVSILVLMELGLELTTKAVMYVRNSSFYPCFNGIRVGTGIVADYIGQHAKFLSLF